MIDFIDGYIDKKGGLIEKESVISCLYVLLLSLSVNMNLYKYINRRIALHIIFWFISGIIMITVVLNVVGTVDHVWERFVVNQISQALIIIFGIKYLIPQFLLKKKLLEFILWSLATVLIMAIAINALEVQVLNLPDLHDRYKDGEPDTFDFIPKLFPHAIALVVAAMGEALHFARMRTEEASHLKSEKLETEMKFLKSQINPHFLFNALNNVYTLAIIQSEETPDVILTLSDMLRYMLYDCKDDSVALSKELDYINNYISLFQLKEERAFNIQTNFDDVSMDMMIPPMLFIPFIENSFKHSKIEDYENSWIKINLYTNGKLIFHIQNSVPEHQFTKDKVGGIGLENVKRRLELIYPNQHQLTIKNENAIFDVRLEINLKKSWTKKSNA